MSKSSRRSIVLGAAATAVASQGVRAEGEAAPVVILKTSLGEIHVELNPKKAPVTTANFLDYVSRKHFDGLVFHRVIPEFMIQGGGFTPALEQRPVQKPIKLEAKNGLKNERGAIAMARTSDPDSATSQFFINVVNNGRLDYPNPDGNGYAVFGKVIQGMDVVDKIVAVPRGDQGGHQNVPKTPVVIESARLKEKAAAAKSTSDQ